MKRPNIDVTGRRVLMCALALVASLPFALAQIVSSSSLRGLSEERNIGEVLLLPASRTPAFDVDSARVQMERASNELRLYVFAHKLHQEVDIIKEGKRDLLPDGTQIWRYRVRSAGAKSLSFFFDRFELPEGGLLYIYDSFKPQNKIGGFGAVNNNLTKVLPTMPIAAEDVIIEVQAPSGTLPTVRLAEVNHGVRELGLMLRSIPKYELGGIKGLECTPELACASSYADMGRGVVLIAIDGAAMGTGTLVNNTSGDGTPYILTAAHVMSKNFRSTNVQRNAENTVVFFNYSSPTCSGEIAPSTTQTLAGASLVGYQDKTDVALLKMNHRPPREYNAYYAGWNASGVKHGAFVNIHHPGGYAKRINFYDNTDIAITSYPSSALPFEPQQHYTVPSWTMGTTAAGSSGSPLFDANNLVIGGLSGGNSFCEVKAADYFFALEKLWERIDPESNSIINALDPSRSRQTLCYGSTNKEIQDELITRITNITLRKGESIREDMPQLSRAELLDTEGGATMIGEYYRLRRDTKIHGLYMMVSTTSDAVIALPDDASMEIVVYKEDGLVELGKGEINLKEGFPLLSGNKATYKDRPIMAELNLIFPQPLLLSSDEGVIFGVKNSSIPEGITLLHQQHQERDRNTLYRMNHNRWGIASQSVSLWIDPMISHPLISKKNENQPLVRVENVPGYGIIITLPVPDEHENKIDIYTLQGQRLYSADILGGKHLLPRTSFEGIGVVLMHVQVGDKEETIKALFPVGRD